MFGIIIGIAAAVAIGALVAYAVVMTFRWLKNKIKEKFQSKQTRKVAVADLEQLISECDNKVSLSELDSLSQQGCTHVMASVDSHGKVIGDVEVIKDKSDQLDEDVDRLLGAKGMVVVEA